MAGQGTTKKRGRRPPRRNSDSDSDRGSSRSPKRVKRTSGAEAAGGTTEPSESRAGNNPGRSHRTVRTPQRHADQTTTPQSRPRRRRGRRGRRSTRAISSSPPPSLSGQTLVPSDAATPREEDDDDEEDYDDPLPFGMTTPEPNTDARCDEDREHVSAPTLACSGPHPVPYFVCTFCIQAQGFTLGPVENDAVEGHKVPICQGCATAEMQRRANGEWKLCTCLERVRNGTRCSACRVTAMNDIRGEARERREQSFRDGWREWMCGVCGTQLEGQRGGKACLACLGVDVERAPATSTDVLNSLTAQLSQEMTNAGPSTTPATFTMSQDPQGMMDLWPTTTTNPMGFLTSQVPQETTGLSATGQLFSQEAMTGWLTSSGFTPAPPTIEVTDLTSQELVQESSNWLESEFAPAPAHDPMWGGIDYEDQHPGVENGNLYPIPEENDEE